MKRNLSFFCIFLISLYSSVTAQDKQNDNYQYPIEIKGVIPSLSLVGDHIGRSETGIGALIPWADKLWMIGYVAHIKGSGIGLYSISEDMTMQKHPESVTGTYANRTIHNPSNQAIISPHLIDIHGNVLTINDLEFHCLTTTMDHLFKPDSLVYYLTMEGLLFEANVYTLETILLVDLVDEFYKKSINELYKEGIYIHFKGGYSGNGMWANGWDKASVKLQFFSPYNGKWRTYRLPKSGQTWEHAWNTEWMRIREAQTERFMMDVFGIFYELPVMVYGDNMLPIKPVCNHLRVIPDFTYWRGLFVLAGDQVDNAVGQPQSNLLYINIDDLWRWGKPSGWGAVWREENPILPRAAFLYVLMINPIWIMVEREIPMDRILPPLGRSLKEWKQ